MIDLNHLILFKKIADCGGITRAAEDLRLPKSAVSQRLSQLEEQLGVRLFHRSTRKMALTEFGEMAYRHAALIAEQKEILNAEISTHSDEPHGVIRMTAPPDIGAHLTRTVLQRIQKDHPGIQIELDLSTRYVDLINEGYDLAIRATDSGLESSNLVATKLHETTMRLFAADSYMRAHPAPKRPEELVDHPFIGFGAIPFRKDLSLELKNNDRRQTVTLKPALMTSNFQGVYEAVKAGMGIGVMPEKICSEDLREGSIVPVLPEWKLSDAKFYAVYPSKKFLPAKTKLMLEYLGRAW